MGTRQSDTDPDRMLILQDISCTGLDRILILQDNYVHVALLRAPNKALFGGL